MTADNNAFESFEMFHINDFISSSQLSETRRHRLLSSQSMEETVAWKGYEIYLKSHRK